MMTTERALIEALGAVHVADSNDDEIQALNEALDIALELLEIERPVFCENCDEGNVVDEHDMCSSCLHNAYRSGWEPGVTA